jgi:hypothetical protein
MHGVRMSMIDYLAKIDPWTVEELERQTAEVKASLARIPIPATEWIGPLGDPWLRSWEHMDPLLMCGLSVLSDQPPGDELLSDPELRRVIAQAAVSDDGLIRRAARPVAVRLGLPV